MKFSGIGVLAALFVAMLQSSASAAPSSSCGKRFVGSWNWGYGSTVINGDGTAIPSCMGCTPVQYWSCSGDSFTYRNADGSGPWTMTLSPDGTTLSGAGVTARRTSGAAVIDQVLEGRRRTNAGMDDAPAPKAEQRRKLARTEPPAEQKSEGKCYDISPAPEDSWRRGATIVQITNARCGRPIAVRVCLERINAKPACAPIRLDKDQAANHYTYKGTGKYTDTRID